MEKTKMIFNIAITVCLMILIAVQVGIYSRFADFSERHFEQVGSADMADIQMSAGADYIVKKSGGYDYKDTFYLSIDANDSTTIGFTDEKRNLEFYAHKIDFYGDEEVYWKYFQLGYRDSMNEEYLFSDSGREMTFDRADSVQFKAGSSALVITGTAQGWR